MEDGPKWPRNWRQIWNPGGPEPRQRTHKEQDRNNKQRKFTVRTPCTSKRASNSLLQHHGRLRQREEQHRRERTQPNSELGKYCCESDALQAVHPCWQGVERRGPGWEHSSLMRTRRKTGLHSWDQCRRTQEWKQRSDRKRRSKSSIMRSTRYNSRVREIQPAGQDKSYPWSLSKQGHRSKAIRQELQPVGIEVELRLQVQSNRPNFFGGCGNMLWLHESERIVDISWIVGVV